MKTSAAVASLLALTLSMPSRAQEEQRPKDYLLSQPPKVVAKKPAPPIDLFEFYLIGEAIHDNNVNHLLINSNIDSSIHVHDDALHTGAAVTVNPLRGHDLKMSVSYGYDRYDYRSHNAFSYYDHGASVSLYPRIYGGTSLELGGELDWIGDIGGALATTQAGRAGVLWVEPKKLRLRAGFEYEKDVVQVNGLKSSKSPILYAGTYWRFAKGQTAVLTYSFRNNVAQGQDFSYRSHWAKLGWINGWTQWFKITWSSSFEFKNYAHVDDRFLIQRRDRTLRASVKPVLTIVRGLDLFADYTYTQNLSNVVFKKYNDQITSAGLEARF